MNPVQWGLLSTAKIGRLMAEASKPSQAARFVAVASRDGDRARQFAADLGLEMAFASYEDLLASDRVDAVYVALPNSMHAEWVIKALTAGKHVLCEKPFALDPADVRRAFDVATDVGRVCAEGFMYRYHPQTLLARRLVADGAIGTLKHVRAVLSVTVPDGDIRRNGALGGGAYADLGCYCVSAARLFAGQPQQVYAAAVRDANGLDVRLAATMRHQHDVLTQLDIAMDLPLRHELELIGSEGVIVVPDPWLCRGEVIEIRRGDQVERRPVGPERRYALAHDDHDVYRIELDAVSAAIAGGTELPFGRADAIDQVTALAALISASETGAPVPLG